jgi:periplasmic copper chaperone A
MKTNVLIPAMAALATAFATAPALAHNTFSSMTAPAGYVQDLEMRVTHGCKGSPVNAVKIKIPEGVTRVTVNMVRDWKVETKMRKLPKPVPGEGGTMLTETVDEIIWSSPKSVIPALGTYEGFRFRASLPNTPGAILFFKTINVCEKGDDAYIDLPKTALPAVGAPDFGQKLIDFMAATPGPAPYLILEKPAKPQYPWGNATPTPRKVAAAP